MVEFLVKVIAQSDIQTQDEKYSLSTLVCANVQPYIIVKIPIYKYILHKPGYIFPLLVTLVI